MVNLRNFKILLAYSIVIFNIIYIMWFISPRHNLKDKYMDIKFNETGFGFNIVPNIVHYVLFGVEEIQFSHFLSLLSVLKNQRPERIYIHCDCNQLSGDYYQRVLRVANKTNTQIIIRTIERPTEIFGQRLSEEWLNWHSSDITRIRVLQEFGGIYLDRDVYVVQSLDVFRKFEMTLDWDERKLTGNQILIANKHARLLKLWLHSYHDYHSDLWYYNAGEVPTKILEKMPELVHRVKGRFGAEGPDICPMLFSTYYENWRKDYYAIHLFIRGNEVTEKEWCFSGNIPDVTTFNENMAPYLWTTFGEMMNVLLHFELRINEQSILESSRKYPGQFQNS